MQQDKKIIIKAQGTFTPPKENLDNSNYQKGFIDKKLDDTEVKDLHYD
jgi:hypothetical protein